LSILKEWLMEASGISAKNPMVKVMETPNYRRLFIGSSTSLLGDQFALIAVPWFVLQITNDPLVLGMNLALEGFPLAIFMLLGGAVTDRVSPRLVMLISDLIRLAIAVLMVIAIWNGAAQLWMVYAFSLIFGLVSGFAIPAANSIIPSLIDAEALPAGNSLMMGSDQIIRFFGPTVAGILIGGYSHSVTGIGLAFTIDAFSFAVSAFCLWVMKSGRLSGTTHRPQEGIWESILIGIRYMWQDPALRKVTAQPWWGSGFNPSCCRPASCWPTPWLSWGRRSGALNSKNRIERTCPVRYKHSFLIAILFILIASIHIPAAASSGLNSAALDSVIEAQMAKHGIPGVALAVIENGRVTYSKGYGVDGRGTPMTPTTPMLIGSQSKSFTALAVNQLADQGKLDLNAPVQTIIPWFRVDDEQASRQITINQLLHHTSGLSDAGFSVVLPNHTSLEAAVRSLAKAQLTAPVGTKYQYFNMGYTVLAYVIELTGGQSYTDTIQTRILTPLGMTASTADPLSFVANPRSAAANPRSAAAMPPGYTRLFGFAVPMRESIPTYAIGAGYLVSTAEDMARYAIAVQKGGAGLVAPETMKRILTPVSDSYGMGWYIVDGGRKIFHGGANQTFRTEVNIYPDQNRAFVLLTNLGYQVDHFISAGQLTSEVEAIVLGNTPAPVSQGWSVRWVGWGLGTIVLALICLHTHNFLALRGWRERNRRLPTVKRVWDVAVSFVIPIAILTVVFTQVGAFYRDRFNLLTSLAYMPFGMPDVFLLILVGTFPDLIQGIVKVILLCRK
jgi:CubicO group peptidase (beta-lactamase class C family)